MRTVLGRGLLSKRTSRVFSGEFKLSAIHRPCELRDPDQLRDAEPLAPRAAPGNGCIVVRIHAPPHCDPAQRWHAFRRTSGSGPVYQGRFKAFPVESDAHFLTVARYVERNPLRAGLVQHAEDWRWSGLRRVLFGTGEDGRLLAPWPIDRPAMWREWVNGAETAAELAALRQSANRGRPYGTMAWQQLMTRRLGLESAYRSMGRPRRAGAGEDSGTGGAKTTPDPFSVTKRLPTPFL